MLANWTFLCLSGCSQPSTNATDFGSYKLRGLARFTEVLLFAFSVAEQKKKYNMVQLIRKFLALGYLLVCEDKRAEI